MLLPLDMVLQLNPLMRFQSPPTRSPNPPMQHLNLPTQLSSHPMRSPTLPTTSPATTPVEMLVILERLATTSTTTTTTTPRLPTPGRRLSSVTASTWRTTIRSRGTLRDLSPCSQTLGESHHQATLDSDSLGRGAAESLTWTRLLLILESLSLLMKTMMKKKLRILTFLRLLMLKPPKQKKVQRRFQSNLHSSLLRTGRRGAQMV